MLTYLREREYYEDLYDKGTIEQCRGGERIVNEAFRKVEDLPSAAELKDKPVALYLEYGKYYFYFVEFTAGKRYHQRDKIIDDWMERDKQKDQRLAEVHLPSMPFCLTCGRNMRVMDKYYMHRDKDTRRDNDILFLLECEPGHKRRTLWEDGTEWESPKIYCEKCNGEMSVKHKETKKTLTSTYACSQCKHSYAETLDLSDKPGTEEPIDPFYEVDRKRFCIDSDTMRKIEDRMEHLARLSKLYADASERTEHADVYDAVKDIKQLKIAQLIEALRPILEKAQYSEFKLGEPQLGQDVIIEFSCLDASHDRKEYDSKNGLRKLINKTLEESNWRLMNEGVAYRLGYLTGRLRAYEGEEALKKLVEQRIKKGTLKPKEPEPPVSQNFDFEKLDKVEAIKIYSEGEKLTVDSTPIDNGTKRPDRRTTLRGDLHHNLRVVIPLRDNDESVPEFIRKFDFKMVSSSVHKKSTGSKGKLKTS